MNMNEIIRNDRKFKEKLSCVPTTKLPISQLLRIIDYPTRYLIKAKTKHVFPNGPMYKLFNLYIHEY